jgi:integral membrane protein
MTFPKTPLTQLRWVAFLEGLSFLLLLFVAMPLKYMAGIPEFVRVIGMAHGVLFLAYIPLTFRAAMDRDWAVKTTGWVLLASLIPFGTFVADARILKPEALKQRD